MNAYLCYVLSATVVRGVYMNGMLYQIKEWIKQNWWEKKKTHKNVYLRLQVGNMKTAVDWIKYASTKRRLRIMRFWFKSKKEKERLEDIKPFTTYLLSMVEKNSQDIQDKATITGRDPLDDDDNKEKEYLFKVASVYSFWKARYVDHVYIYIKNRIPDYKRIDKVAIKLTSDDILFLNKLLMEWM